MYKKAVLVLLVFANVLAWTVVLSSNNLLEVSFFDVGQGDSMFIEMDGRQIVIDGGPSSAVEKIAKEIPFYDRTLDLMILTHPENDHLFGLLEVLKRYKVENILWTGVIRNTAEYNEWVRLIEKEGSRIIIAKAGEKIDLGKGYIQVLSPFDDLSGKETDNSNDSSVVVRLVYGNNSFLFTGDISSKEEKELLDIKADVLKVAHHGSKNSSSPEFIKAVSPKIAVIQVGQDNNYGHPTPEVLLRLKESDIDVLRTDINGDIKIVSNGNNLKILK